MGTGKILFLGGLLGGIFLLLMGWVAFASPLDLGGAVTGGLLTNMNALFSLLGAIPGFGAALSFILPMLIGGVMLAIFPMDWALSYRPDDLGLMFGLLIPWAVAGVLVALIFAHNAKQGFLCGMSLAVYPIILGIIAYAGLNALGGALGGGGIDIGGILNGVVEGLVDRSMLLAILSATLEGGALGGVFGALIGSLKYEPGQVKKGKKSKAKSKAKGKGEPREEGKKEEDFFVDFE